jgi:cytochrome c biogenesis protein CcmG/thiol:disulfide interchange protein DsbE
VKRSTVIHCVVLLLLAVFAWVGWVAAASRPVSPLVGKPAPAFALEDLNGTKVSLASFQGKAVLINFWATWCGPCKIETPWLVDLRSRYAPQGFEILGVSADDIDHADPAKLSAEKKQIARSAAQSHIPYPVLIDGGSLGNSYGGLDQLPTSIYVNRKGLVVAVQQGITSKSEIEANIKKALAN